MTANIPKGTIECHNDVCFDLFESEDNMPVSDNDIDPNLNYFRSTCDVLSKCNYHLEDSFMDLIKEKDSFKKGISLLHLNIRSCQKTSRTLRIIFKV